jgi:hypothetical protein
MKQHNEDFQGVTDQHALSDKMPIRYDFEVPFEVKTYEKEEWNHFSTEQSILIYYTDGYRKDGMTGMGIYDPSVRYYEALHSKKVCVTATQTLCLETITWILCCQNKNFCVE